MPGPELIRFELSCRRCKSRRSSPITRSGLPVRRAGSRPASPSSWMQSATFCTPTCRSRESSRVPETSSWNEIGSRYPREGRGIISSIGDLALMSGRDRRAFSAVGSRSGRAPSGLPSTEGEPVARSSREGRSGRAPARTRAKGCWPGVYRYVVDYASQELPIGIPAGPAHVGGHRENTYDVYELFDVFRIDKVGGTVRGPGEVRARAAYRTTGPERNVVIPAAISLCREELR